MIIKKAVLKILVNSCIGDEVTINLPIALGEALIKGIVNSNLEKIDSDVEILKSINFDQIFELVKSGAIGEIVNVKSSAGDTVVIKIEY